MNTPVEATHQETLVLAHVRGAGLHFTKNRRTILAGFLAGTEPVTITAISGFGRKRLTLERRTAPYGNC